MSTKKAEAVTTLLKKVKVGRGLPSPVKGVTLLEQGLLAVISRTQTQTRAESGLASLKANYEDWNEARVAQAQEIATHLLGKKKGDVAKWLPTAREVKTYLHEVFQKTHGLDLDFFAQDLTAASKLVNQMPVLGMYDGTYLLWLAGNQEMPVHTGLVRVLDRLGLITRTTSMKKARAAIGPIVPKGGDLGFAATFGHVSEKWCDARKPVCHECPLVGDCRHGAKVYADWQAQQVRLEAQRARAEKQRLIQEKKEEERRKREEERQRKRADQMAKKLERERLKKRRELERQRAAEQKRKEAEKKKKDAEKAKLAEAAKKKKAAEAAKKKKAADAAKKKKAAEAAKKKKAAEAAKKKKAAEAAKKKAAKKPVKKAAKKTTKKAAKKTTKKAAKKATKKTTKKATKKAAKKTTKKAAAKTTKKAAAKKTTKKKAPAKKAAAKKTTKKKAAKKKTAKKKK